MDTEGPDTEEFRAPQQGSSSSCRTADAAVWDAAQQQKRQRCQASSSDQAESSTSNSMQISEPEPQDLDPAKTEEAEDYYMEDDCDDDGYDEDEYEFDEAGFNQHLADKFDVMDLPPGVEATVPWLQKIAPKEEDPRPSDVDTTDENTKKYNQFKQFDTVQNFTDHHFAQNSQGEPTRAWSKRIQHDWKLLEKDLPASIYVRVAEDRMDLLRAAIVGPKGTPYHDGLFFFDVHFPSSYPAGPPLVHYHSGGLRLNPNLYGCGKVCLSLLGTWSGHGCEQWNSAQSTMLQVLVSIQALILNEMPYFNEPGFEASANTAHGQQRATDYNDSTFLLSCKTMLYSLRRPPEHFADLVAGHFRVHGHTILAACKYYLEGNAIGSAVPEDKEESDCFGDAGASSSNEAPKAVTSASGSSGFGAFKCTDTDGWGPHIRLHCDKFRGSRSVTSRVNLLNKRFVFNAGLKTLFEDLLMEFNVKGADTRKFIAEKLKKKTTRSLRRAGRGFRNASN